MGKNVEKQYLKLLKDILDRGQLPTIALDYRNREYNQNLKEFLVEDFVLFDYNPHPPIKAPLSN